MAKTISWMMGCLMATLPVAAQEPAEQEKYMADYLQAKALLNENLSGESKKLVYRQYVINGYLLACQNLKKDENGKADYGKARKMLMELAPYADDELKAYVLPKIPLSWYYEGAEHYIKHQFDQALVCFEEARRGYQQLGRKDDEAMVLQHIAFIKNYKYDTDGAIADYEKALELARQTGNEQLQMAVMKSLLDLNRGIGDMEECALYTARMNELAESTQNIQVRLDFYIQQGKEADALGQTTLAEQWFLKGKSIAESLDSAAVNANRHQVYVSLRDLYTLEKRYDKAVEYGRLALEEFKRNSKPGDMSYYDSYISLANIYSRMGDRENCYACLDSLFTTEKFYRTEPVKLRQLYMMRGMCRFYLKEYEEAMADFKKAQEVLGDDYSELDGARAGLYPMMGGTEHKLGNHAEAERYYTLYAKAVRRLYGEQSIDYMNALIYLANAEGFAGHLESGCTHYTEAAKGLRATLKARLPYLDTAEREGFWKPLSELLTRMTPYALKAGLHDTEFTESCYDALLMSKAFLLDSERSLYAIIRKEGDETDMQLYMQIAAMRNRMKEWEKDYTANADSILAVANRIGQLEGKLMKRCKPMGNMTAFMDVDYRTVKGTLKQDEVLLDFTDYTSESEGRKYAAYLVDREQEHPLLMPLFAEREVDSLGIARLDMFYDRDYAADVLELLWKPLEKHISKGATVYYVPSQLLFQVCLESLPLEDGSLLGDHYNFVRLSSARELVNGYGKVIDRGTGQPAVLYGGLQYDVEPELMAQQAQAYDLSDLLVMRGDMVRGDQAFGQLPGTLVEVKQIAKILDKADFGVKMFTGMEGTEESFLSLHGHAPKILHLATHGFYFTPADATEVDYLKGYTDAMNLSGLILAGGNAAWRGETLPKNVLGGVLTANSIARLDLRGTDLVVLSACQSGQGNATAEGLYGLQRAFKKAGAGTIVMALWQVSDRVATDFMLAFYKGLANNGWNKRVAFEQAKAEIRRMYPDPFYWAAFVMLD